MSWRSLVLLGRSVRWMLPLVRWGPGARRTAADLFERRAARRPEAVFVRFEGRDVGYGDHNTAANQNADARLVTANQTVHHGGSHPARIILPQVPNPKAEAE